MEMSIQELIKLIDRVKEDYEQDYDDDNSIFIPLLKQAFIEENQRQRDLADEL